MFTVIDGTECMLSCIVQRDRVIPAMDDAIVCSAPRHRQDCIYIDLGCGKNRKDGFVGIDIIDFPGVMNVDINREGVLYPFDDSSVCGIRAIHALEHIASVVKLWNEMYRICRNGALIYAVVPHPQSSLFYQDPTHKSFYTEETFRKYLSGDYVSIFSDYGLVTKIVPEYVFCFGETISKLCVHALMRVIK